MTQRQINEIERAINEKSNLSVILSSLSEIIKPINLPDYLEDNFKFFLISTLYTGKGFIVSDLNGKLHYTHGELVAPFDDYGYGKNYITYTKMGTEYKGELNVNGCVIFPYASRMRINVFDETADHLAEIMSSEKFLLKWAKVAPFLFAKDSKTKQAIQDVIKSVMSGNMTPILSENVISDIMIDGKEKAPVIMQDVFQPERVRDLEYISNYKDSLLKDIYHLFGIPVQLSTKKAQQSIDEINALNGSCYVLPLDILSNFKTFAKNLNRTFGLNVDFKLNDLIENEIAKYYNTTDKSDDKIISDTGEKEEVINNDDIPES